MPSQAQTLAALSASTSPKKWAEMDDDDEPAFATTAIATTAAKVDEATVSAENGEPAIARVQENDIAAEPPLSEPIVEVPTSVDSAAPPQQAPIATQTAGRATQPANMPSRPRATSGRFQQPWPKEPAVVIDEDGFETKIRRAPQQAFRGRGGGGGDRGSGSLGRGRGGRGGGAPQGQGPRPPRKDGPPNQPQQSGQSAIQAKAKSIFKEVQPGAPTSAPVS